MSQSYENPAGDDPANHQIKVTLPARDEAIRSHFSGGTEPSAPVGHQYWADTTNKLLKQRNTANNAWNVVGPLNDAVRHTMQLQLSGALATGEIQFPCSMAMTIEKVMIVPDTATTGSSAGATDWTFQLRNVTEGIDLFASAFSTGTTELAADAVNSLLPDQNQSVAANDVLRLTVGQNGSPTAVPDVSISVAFTLVGI